MQVELQTSSRAYVAVEVPTGGGGIGEGGTRMEIDGEGIVKECCGDMVQSPGNDDPEQTGEKSSTDLDSVDEVLKDSFPASDPPPWTTGKESNHADCPSELWNRPSRLAFESACRGDFMDASTIRSYDRTFHRLAFLV